MYTKESLIPKVNINLINDFISELDVCERSKKSYRINVIQFFQWTFQKGYDVSKLNRVDILNFKKWLGDTGKTPLTINAYLTAIKKYYSWMSINNFYSNIAEGVRLPKKIKSFGKMPLSLDQTKTLLTSINTDTLIGIRDFTIISLMVRNGLRVGEIETIKISDIVEENLKKVIYIKGKGRTSKDCSILLTENTSSIIDKYLKYAKVTNRDEPLFKSFSPANYGQPLSRQSISKLVKRYFKNIGLNDKRYTAHSLRHTAACLLIEMKIPIFDIQLYLRHSSTLTTEHYTVFMQDRTRLQNASGLQMDAMFADIKKVYHIEVKQPKRTLKQI